MGTQRALDVAIVADDLTGAADSAAEFAGGGRQVSVALGLASLAAADVLAIDTDSRERGPAVATTRVWAAVEALGRQAPRRWLKKVDSTLRGNVAAEAQAFVRATACDVLLLAPAFPAQGRGYVDGALRFVTAAHAEEAASGDLRASLAAASGQAVSAPLALVRAGSRAVAALFARLPPGAIVAADAVNDADLDALLHGAALSGRRVAYAGSAGLATALARQSGFVASPAAALAGRRAVLIVVGSRNVVSRRQLAVATDRLARPITVDVRRAGPGDAALQARHSLERHGCAILTTSDTTVPDGAAVAEALVDAATLLVRAEALTRVFVTGGDIARLFCDRLGIARLEVLGSLADGIPVLMARDGCRGQALVTKAGGFGDDAVILRACAYLMGQE